MSISVTEGYNQAVDKLFTSVGGSMRTQNTHKSVVVRVLPSNSETSNTEQNSVRDWLIISERTTSGLTLSSQSIACIEVTRSALNELRRLSGLTWDQLARLFNVSRRSLHFWASGERLSRFNEESLNRLLSTIRYIDRGSASINRSILLIPRSDGSILLDLLAVGRYEEVKQLLGPGGVIQRPQLEPLSPSASALRMPQKPEDLVDAQHDPIHRDVGRAQVVRAVRTRKRDTKQ